MADANLLDVAIVSAEHAIWSGQAKSVVAKTPEGDIGILAGHEPVLALLVDSSPLRIEEADGTRRTVAVHGGFFSVARNTVNVIAEVAELAEDIDVARAQAALSRIEADNVVEPGEQAALRRAETRISVAGVAKGISTR